MLLSYAGIGFPQIIDKTIISVGSLTTPLALLVIGAGFQGKKAVKNMKPAVGAATIELVVQPLLFLPIAVALGFSADKIAAVLVMLGAPTTATAYVMARSHGHEGVLSTSVIVITTLFSAFTITAWIFVLRYFGII
jgi:predicted permease